MIIQIVLLICALIGAVADFFVIYEGIRKQAGILGIIIALIFLVILSFVAGYTCGRVFNSNSSEQTVEIEDDAEDEASEETKDIAAEDASEETKDIAAEDASDDVEVSAEVLGEDPPDTPAPVEDYFVDNDYYECYIMDVSWDEAYDICENKGGHLLTIDSDKEYNDILKEFAGHSNTDIVWYIGACRPDNNSTVQYHWVYDTKYADVNQLQQYWLIGEPSLFDNELQIDEMCVALQYNEGQVKWGFNDIPNAPLKYIPDLSGRIGFICEYEQMGYAVSE